MGEPDEALLWARDDAGRPWAEMETEYFRQVQAGDWDHNPIIEGRVNGYRAGQAASANRIKALEEALRDALPHLENCFAHHGWHTERPPEPDYIVIIRNLLKEADQ
jgi:glycine/D-amino acid oxidase-like deaminating enzyme